MNKMTSRPILQALNEYQTARLRFVQTVSDLASRTHNVEVLETAGVLDLLQPLVVDVVPSIQQTAVLALGKLANQSETLAHAVVEQDFISQLLRNIEKQNKFFKRAVLFLLRAVAKHSPDLASAVVDKSGLKAIINCLEDFDPGVKEAAAWATGYVTRHNVQLAQTAVDAGVVPLLVLCLQEPEVCLKQIGASALCDISKHSPELGQTVADAGAIPYLARAIANPDVKLKRQGLNALGSIAKHSVNLAESVVEADIFPEVLSLMAHRDEGVQRAAAILTREICKHSQEVSDVGEDFSILMEFVQLAELVVNTGGIAALTQLVASSSATRLPAITALGFIAGQSDQMATTILASKGSELLVSALSEEREDHLQAIIVWALGHMGKHSPDHAKAIAATNVLPKLLQLFCSSASSEDLRGKVKMTLKHILQQCEDVETLEPLLSHAPPEILKYVLGKFSRILPHDPRARRLFVTTGGLKKVQEIQAEADSNLNECIALINSCFPEEIVRYYSPGFPETLLDIVEQYQPKRPPTLESTQSSESSTSNTSLRYNMNKRNK